MQMTFVRSLFDTYFSVYVGKIENQANLVKF